MPAAKLELVDTMADTVRLVGQGRADAIVENIDFFMAFTKNYPDVKWRVLPRPDRRGLLRDRRQPGQREPCEVLNIALYKTCTASGKINELWEQYYGAPMLVKVEPSPYF